MPRDRRLKASLRQRLGVIAATALVFAAPATGAAQQTRATEEPQLPPIEALSETVERPLFLPNRRPPTVEETVEESEAAESGLFTLVGIIVSPNQKIALVKVRGSQEVLQLSEGQQANGWTVLEIRPGNVIFESKDKTETIELIDIKPPSPRRSTDRQREPRQPAQNTERP